MGGARIFVVWGSMGAQPRASISNMAYVLGTWKRGAAGGEGTRAQWGSCPHASANHGHNVVSFIEGVQNVINLSVNPENFSQTNGRHIQNDILPTTDKHTA